MISHIPLFTHPKPEKVLIIGGGDGGTAREVLRHPEVKRVVMIEIDEMVVSACREYIPATSSSLDDPRLEIRFEDGVKFAAETDETFDVALIDSTDPAGPAIPLFTSPFYESIANLLTEDGIMVAQAESPFFDYDYQTSLLNNQRPYFQKLHLYLFSTLTYPGGLWCFSYASGGLCPIKDFNPGRVESSGIKTRYYNSQIHCSAFMLPTFIAENYESVLDPVSLADMKR
jgi:spermidine synthase